METTLDEIEMIPVRQETPRKAGFRGAGLRELLAFLVSFSRKHGVLSDDDCLALALGACAGHAHAEFLVATAYDAADEPMQAKRWYTRAARHGFLPSSLRLQYL